MTTTVPSKNDWDKALARFAAIEARLDALENTSVPKSEPAPVEPVPPQPVPVPTVTTGLTRSRSTLPPNVIRTPADLVAGRFMMPFSAAVAKGAGPLPAYSYSPGAYESVGLQKDMGATGERQELGLVTEAQADWLSGGKPDNMMAQAEAHGSVPIHAMIDGRVIDVVKNPLATFDWRAPGAGWKPFFDLAGQTVKPDTAHYPALSYVPYLASGDRYYLEELQFAATWHICGSPPDYHQGKGIIYPWQQRWLAWGLRDVIAAYIATLEAEKAGAVAAPLLPSSYWKTIIDNNVAYLTARYLNSTDALTKEMGFFLPDDGKLAVWQQDYLSMVLGWAVWTGKVPQVKPLYDFQIRGAVKRATGPLRSQAIAYEFPAGLASTWAATLILNGRKPAADDHLATASFPNAPDYPGFLRGALRVAVMNSVPGADAAFAYADFEAKNLGFIARRWAV